jgi:hypothetical protein
VSPLATDRHCPVFQWRCLVCLIFLDIVNGQASSFGMIR